MACYNWTVLRPALGLAATVVLSMPANAAPPEQLAGCPMVTFWHAAKHPNKSPRADYSQTWFSPPNNGVKTPSQGETVAVIAKRRGEDADQLRKEICPTGHASCVPTMVGATPGGFATNFTLVIPTGRKESGEPTFLSIADLCDDFETERFVASCGIAFGDALIHVVYQTGDSEDLSVWWEQVFERATGKLLLTSDVAVTPNTDRSALSIEGCGSWSVDALIAGRPPEGSGAKKPAPAAASASVKEKIAAGRKATAAKDYALAVGLFSAAIDIQSDALEAWSGRGYAHLLAGRPTEALADFDHLTANYADAMTPKFKKAVEHNIALAKKGLKK